jgi:hypothetical protein
MAMQVETKASALFNLFNASVCLLNETDDASGPFQYAGDQPTNFLISEEQKLKVQVDWSVGGLIPAISKLDYTAILYIDGTEIDRQVVTAGPINPNVADNYSTTLTMRAGLPVGVHRMTVTLTVKVNGPGGFNLPVAGFQDLGNIQVYPS